MYHLIFSQNFKDDVKQSINYIKYTLPAPVAAGRLKVEIKKTEPVPKLG
jgi:hypothetical protein